MVCPAPPETTGDMKTPFLKAETPGNIPAAGVADRPQVVADRQGKERRTMDRVNVDKAGLALGVFLSADSCLASLSSCRLRVRGCTTHGRNCSRSLSG